MLSYSVDALSLSAWGIAPWPRSPKGQSVFTCVNILKVVFNICVIMFDNETVHSCKASRYMGLNGDVILRWLVKDVPLLLEDTKDSLNYIASLSML
jgi:hypothetical protein